MRSLRTVLLIGAALLSLTAASHADTVQLKSGAILVGDITILEDGRIRMGVRFPSESAVTLEREELTPRSLYDLLDRRSDPKDVDARLRLGKLAEASGLFGLAIADFLSVAESRPALEVQMKARIAQVREAIASGILEDARGLLEQGNPRGALLYLHTLKDLYADTEAAKRDAEALMKKAHEHAGESAEVAEKTVPADKVERVIAAVEKDVKKGERDSRALSGHAGSSSRDRKAAERATKHFEAAWKGVKTLPITAPDSELAGRIQALRKSTKDRLLRMYLKVGTIYLQRSSLPQAEDYCNKACELAPDDEANHELHRLIIQAKTYQGYGRGGR